jgi:hypothetical protein
MFGTEASILPPNTAKGVDTGRPSANDASSVLLYERATVHRSPEGDSFAVLLIRNLPLRLEPANTLLFPCIREVCW